MPALLRLRPARVGLPVLIARVPPLRIFVVPAPVIVPPVQVVVTPLPVLKSSAPVSVPLVKEKFAAGAKAEPRASVRVPFAR